MKQARPLIREMRLALLRNFLDHVGADAAEELESIEERRINGVFETFEDHELAEGFPFARIEIASRAIEQELTNLVEGELHAVAVIPWLSSNCKGPKSLWELGNNDPTTLRMVSDLGLGRIIDLINKHYEISVGQLDGWADVDRLRNTVNDLKHRGGVQHYRDLSSGDGGVSFVQFHATTEQQARDAIASVRRFLLALDQAIEDGRRAG